MCQCQEENYTPVAVCMPCVPCLTETAPVPVPSRPVEPEPRWQVGTEGAFSRLLPAMVFVGLGVALALLGLAGRESYQINHLKSQLHQQQQALTQQQAETAARQHKIDAIKAVVCDP